MPSDAEVRAFYNSTAWKRLRSWFRLEHPLCAFCKQRGVVKAGDHVDHIEPVRRAWDRRLDPTNLQHLCAMDHNGVKRDIEAGRPIKGCDESGIPTDPNHPWHRSSGSR